MNAYSLALLGASLAISSYAYTLDRTTVVAGKVGYPQEMVKLRNQADDFLRDVRIRMTIGVQDLRSKDLDLRADEMTSLSKDAYFSLEKKIDDAFDDLSRQFVRGSNKLDDEEASIKEKQLFINKMSTIARQKLDSLLKQKANNTLR